MCATEGELEPPLLQDHQIWKRVATRLHRVKSTIYTTWLLYEPVWKGAGVQLGGNKELDGCHNQDGVQGSVGRFCIDMAIA